MVYCSHRKGLPAPTTNPPNMNKSNYIVYGEAVYGPFETFSSAYAYATEQGWRDYECYDNMDDAQLAVEAEWDR